MEHRVKIYYLTGYPPIGDSGGGGLANTSLIDEGIRLGHTIEIYTSGDEVPEGKPDLYWLSNMNGRFSLEFLHDVTDDWSIPFIIQDDGYQNLCPQPTREYKLCFQDHDLDSDWGRTPLDIWKPPRDQLYDCGGICRYELMHALASRCVASISVSPMHGRIWAGIFPTIVGKQIIVDPQIDPDHFRPTWPHGYDRHSGRYIYVGTIARGKGYLECVDYVDRQGGVLVSAGDIHHTIRRRQVRNWTGRVSQDVLPELYSQCEYFIHLPLWQEPQGRAVMEALLCGCKLICNEKVGALTYPWLDEFITTDTYYMTGTPHHYRMVRLSRNIKRLKARIREAPRKFWDDLGRLL